MLQWKMKLKRRRERVILRRENQNQADLAVASSVCSNGRERINPPRTPSNPERRVDSKLSPSSRAVKLISIVACYIAHGARKS
mmetsp:Transcript_20910/g.31205  ORF Transcript_20910/g.31205 Transcript_20910/m.31205 type:complete len:83 (+) Transcript_20910:2471-2719(+)